MAEKSTQVEVRKSTPATGAGKASARFSEGVPSITVPKSAQTHSKVKKIDVKAS